MKFPPEIESIIKEYAQPCAATLRPNWRQGSSNIWKILWDPWWNDFEYASSWKYSFYYQYTWVQWCKHKMIICPPRWQSEQELVELDQNYLSVEDILRHRNPWLKTWPEYDDYSWCKVRGIPHWAIKEFMEANV